MSKRFLFNFFPIILLITFITLSGNPAQALTSSTGATLIPGPMTFPTSFMPSIKSFGAVGDGVTDDTAAIQSALSSGRSNASADYMGTPKALYFPPGRYLVRSTLKWVGCCVTLQGAGSSSSKIVLAPSSAGFSDSTHPAPVIYTPSGNESFHQNIWDLGIEVGAGNPGASGIAYISNNSGSMHNVQITSDDGHGTAGIDMTRQWAGPLMIRDVAVQGFDVGMDLKNAEYSSTIENVTVNHQNVAGIRNVNQPISIHNLSSVNGVPAVSNTSGFVVLIGATLTGGLPANSAVLTNASMYLRNVSSSGYTTTLKNTSGMGQSSLAGTITSYVVGNPVTLTGSATSGSLNLPIEDTPSFTSATLSDWQIYVPLRAGDNDNLQTTVNSGKHTIYFPFGSYFSYNEVAITVPDSVDRIVGFSSVLNGSPLGYNGGGFRFKITSNSTQPLIIEQFGYGLKIDHDGSRPVVIKNAKATYTSYPGAGNLFLEDVDLANELVVQATQQVWTRQLDIEFNGTKVANKGGTLWMMGLKTEQDGTIITSQANSNTELLGALIYPVVPVATSESAFVSTDANVSYIYTEPVYVAGDGFSNQVLETRAGVSHRVVSNPSKPYNMQLFVGYK